MGPFTGHDDVITGLAFTIDEKALASSSEDSTILIWDVASAAAKSPARGGGEAAIGQPANWIRRANASFHCNRNQHALLTCAGFK